MDAQGHDATTPWQMPPKAWLSVAKRTWSETGTDNIGLIAAGVAFYGFLALVPLLGAIVLVYGIAADPSTVMRNMKQLMAVMPAEVAKLIAEQLMNVVKTSDGKKGFGLLLALGLALFGARNGAGAIITALNVAYEEQEERGFVRLNLLALGITAAAVMVAILALIAVAALGYLQALLPQAPAAVVVLGKVVAYLLLTLGGAGAAATLYRYGPSRRKARWIWLTPGSVFAALMWLALTVGFGIYVANFGNYTATYGSLGTVVVTLTWLYLSSYILLFGAELNAELEQQSRRDTTTADAPSVAVGASVADHGADAGISDAPARGPTAAKPSGVADIVAARVTAQAAQVIGLPKVGWAPSVAATLGLALLRRGRGVAGTAVLCAAAAATWATRARSSAERL